ncbi:PfkB family carbohydrate kinase-like protein [Trichophaea hybrida]|nr:PfkB family carbohydrate kinase-like protein [Trichophaea hybrida]
MTALQDGEIHFTTLGMFIIDEIHYGPPSDRKVANNVIGGAGTYGVVGARLFSPPPLSKTIGWIVDAGYDFPADCFAQLEALQTHLVLRQTPERLTTRGWNSYESGDQRAFRYTTPKKRLEAIDLIKCGLVGAKCVHLICSPARAEGLRNQLFDSLGLDLNNSQDSPEAPIVVWEPVPDLCTPKHRDGLMATLKLVDVVSPNHDELAGFFGDQTLPGASGEWETIEYLATLLLKSGVGANDEGAVIVRAGKNGCLVASRQRGMVRLPAYYESTQDGNHEKVVDPTGGGNTFIGDLGPGWLGRVEMLCWLQLWGVLQLASQLNRLGFPNLRLLMTVGSSGAVRV